MRDNYLVSIQLQFAERMRKARKEKGLTQKQLGELLGVSQSMIGQFESGKHAPRIDTVKKICKALDCRMSDIPNEPETVELLREYGDEGGNERGKNGMTNEQFRAALEAIKAFAEETRDIDKTIRFIERMQGKEKEPTSGTK